MRAMFPSCGPRIVVQLLPCIMTMAVLSAVGLPLQQRAAETAKPSKKAALKQEVKQAGKESEGSLIFQQQCSRCHTAPESFSPRISGTIVRHMRVRASLSQHDEEELLRFFNP